MNVTELKNITAEDLGEITQFYEIYLNSGDTIRQAISSAFHEGIYYGCRAVADGNTAG